MDKSAIGWLKNSKREGDTQYDDILVIEMNWNKFKFKIQQNLNQILAK